MGSIPWHNNWLTASCNVTLTLTRLFTVSDETVKYACGFWATRTIEWLHCKLQTRPLVREGTPQKQDRKFQTGSNIWSQVPQECPIPRHTDWLTVSRKVTSTSTSTSTRQIWVLFRAWQLVQHKCQITRKWEASCLLLPSLYSTAALLWTAHYVVSPLSTSLQIGRSTP
jgi:hypothetical protein